MGTGRCVGFVSVVDAADGELGDHVHLAAERHQNREDKQAGWRPDRLSTGRGRRCRPRGDLDSPEDRYRQTGEAKQQHRTPMQGHDAIVRRESSISETCEWLSNSKKLTSFGYRRPEAGACSCALFSVVMPSLRGT